MSVSKAVSIRIRKYGRDGACLSSEEVIGMDNEICELLNRMKSFPDAAAASAVMDELAELQDTLALLLFKYHVPVSEKQKLLVKKYERWDDPDLRSRFFAAVKEGRFP
jgi:hypothetical protein